MSKDRELDVESPFTTRRAALGVTAAMTAGLLAEKALSPDAARAEALTGKTTADTTALGEGAGVALTSGTPKYPHSSTLLECSSVFTRFVVGGVVGDW